MSITSLTTKILLGATVMAAGFVGTPARTSHAAYNVGVKEIHLNNAATECLEGQALACDPGADSNVLLVQQSLVDGRYEFSGLEGTGLYDDSIWLSADFSAQCRRAHSLVSAQVDTNLSNPAQDGRYLGSFADSPPPWPHSIPVPDARTMSTTRLSMHLPISDAFSDGAIGWYPSPQDVFDLGEAEIQRMVDEEGMTFPDARATEFELTTYVEVAFQAVCDYNAGWGWTYVKRRMVELPLTMRFEPVDVAAPSLDQAAPGGGLVSDPSVTDVELFVVQDPADPCTLHLSGSIHTNAPTNVEYRFINPNGQPSNTYSIAVDATHSVLIDRTVEVPRIENADASDDLAVLDAPSDLDDLYVDVPEEQYSGTYMLEVVSPNHMSDADGFVVDYCDSIGVAPVGGNRTGDLFVGSRPTHG